MIDDPKEYAKEIAFLSVKSTIDRLKRSKRQVYWQNDNVFLRLFEPTVEENLESRLEWLKSFRRDIDNISFHYKDQDQEIRKAKSYVIDEMKDVIYDIKRYREKRERGTNAIKKELCDKCKNVYIKTMPNGDQAGYAIAGEREFKFYNYNGEGHLYAAPSGFGLVYDYFDSIEKLLNHFADQCADIYCRK